MSLTQQTIENRQDAPIYVSVEPWPECFELEPSDKLTLIWDSAEKGDAVQVDFLSERELVVWPNPVGKLHQLEIEFLINGLPAKDRSWSFKHK